MYWFIVCVQMCVCLWRSEDKLWESVLIRWVLGLEFMLLTLALIPHQKSSCWYFSYCCEFLFVVFKTG